MADIFVSYTSSDRAWAFWIAKELEALGDRPRVHEWEIKGGDDIYAWMERHIDGADHVLCVISDAYLKAPYSTLERNAALWQAAGKRPGFVLLVTVQPCRLPALSDHIRRCELFGIPEDAARLRFREFMQKREAPAAAAFPGRTFAVSNIPIRVPEHFLGRDDPLAAIEAALGRYEGRVAITALHGLRGVGKTTLAAVYAERHRGDYRATWWIGAQTPDSMRADLVGLGVRLNWVAADDKEEPALAAVMERLRHEGEGVLLIYDNAVDADALKPYLPRGGLARVLITSNAPAWRGIAEPVEIRLWPRQIGADYLVARTGRPAERETAETLSETLGGLPLAHEQAAAYCERLDISLADYAQRFNAAPAKMLDTRRDAPLEYHDHLTVAKTFALAIDEAAKLHPAAEPLIVHAALLAPEPIPLFLFSEAREQLGEPLFSALAGDGLDEAVAALRAFALVDRESIADERDPAVTTDCLRLHRLVRQVAATRCEDEARAAALRALTAAVVAAYPDNIYRDPDTWPRVRRLDPSALALITPDIMPTVAEEKVAHLATMAGQYRHGALAAYAQARPLYERALGIREKMPGPNHPDTASSLNHLAALLSEQGDLTAARPLYERALAIYEQTLGAEHPSTAASLNNLAILLSSEGEFAAARPLYERALAIWKKAVGEEHPDTASCLNNLATLLQEQGALAQARPLFERALAIRQNVLGADHPHTALSLNNLARLQRQSGRANEAIPQFECAIASGDARLGADHPLTQHFKSGYARALLDIGRIEDAHMLAAAALSAHEAKNGRNHPWTKEAADVTADALDALGRTEEASILRRRYPTASAKRAASCGGPGDTHGVTDKQT